MKRTFGIAAAILFAAGSLSAQNRAIVSIYGGGADHLADLTTTGPAAYFGPGYSLGASVGIELNRRLAVHGDFTFTRNPAWGASPFAGEDVNRFFYGAHLEYRYPLGKGIAPFLFAGAGAVSIDQLGIDTFEPTTRPAVMYGGGVFVNLFGSRFDVFGEVKGLSYRWNMAGFDRTMVDVTFGGGVSYTLPY